MKYFRFCLILLTTGVAVGAAELALVENQEMFRRWKTPRETVFAEKGGPQQSAAVSVTCPDATRSALCERGLELGKYAGKLLSFTGQVRRRGIAKAAKPYYGLKFMVVYTRADGTCHWAEDLKPEERFGSSTEWEPCEVIVKIPENAKAVALSFGIQQASGSADFADLKLEIID